MNYGLPGIMKNLLSLCLCLSIFVCQVVCLSIHDYLKNLCTRIFCILYEAESQKQLVKTCGCRTFLLKSYLGLSYRALREKCPNTQLFLSVFYEVNLLIQSKYREIQTRNNSVFGHFSRNGGHSSLYDIFGNYLGSLLFWAGSTRITRIISNKKTKTNFLSI